MRIDWGHLKNKSTCLLTPLRWLVGLFILAFIVCRLNWHGFSDMIEAIRLGPLALSVGLLFPFLLLKGWRWYFLLSLQDAQYRFSAVMLDFLSGSYVGLVTPGRVGELVRVIYQKQAVGINYGRGLSNVLVDRFLDLGIMVFIAVPGLLFYQPVLPTEVVVTAVILLLMGLMFVGIWGAFKHKWSHFPVRNFIPTNILTRFYRQLTDESTNWSAFQTNFYTGLRQLRQWKIIFPILISVFAFLCLVWQNSLLAQALQMKLPLFYLAFCLAVVNLVTLLPISISGIGTRDATFILLLAEIGIPPEQSLGLSLLFLVTFNLAGVMFGALAWYLRPIWNGSISSASTGDTFFF